jgi:two-component system response regulator YesN
MYNVLIIDDEPRIRDRVKRMLDWEGMELSLAGEAKDGKEALEKAVLLKPDIMITDICLPYINGLDLVEKVQAELPDCKVIMITGHDEFEYAYKAIKLKVFDFVLKPMRKEQMVFVVSKAIKELDERDTDSKYLDWAKCRIRNDLSTVRGRLLNDWIKGYISNDEFYKQKDILGLEILAESALFVINPIEIVEVEDIQKRAEKQNQSDAIQKAVEDLLNQKGLHNHVFIDDCDNIVAITPLTNIKGADEIDQSLRDGIRERLGYSLIIAKKVVDGGYQAIPIVYLEMINKIRRENDYTPIVKKIKEYVYVNYSDNGLTLDKTCHTLRISRTYIWKLLKKELGTTFRELLITTRINKAIELMQDPLLKLYEISEMVGFSSQHYFSIAFKRIVGKAPEEYRKK